MKSRLPLFDVWADTWLGVAPATGHAWQQLRERGEIVAEPIRVQFESGGSTCVGYLYEPQDEGEPRPCVLLCHGLGGTQDTPSIRVAAQTFVGAGFSVLTFDPPELSRETAKRAPRGETIEYPIAHFQVYEPKIREQVLADQVAFLRRHLTDGE